MNLAAWKVKMIEFFHKLTDFPGNFWAKIHRPAKGGGSPLFGKLFSVFKGIKDSFKNLFIRKPGYLPSASLNSEVSETGQGSPSAKISKQQILQFSLGGFIVLFFVLLISALAVNFRKPKTNTVSASAAALSIPSEDLFIPSEPDFLPEFLLQREPRSYWSLEDIEPYWKTPSDFDLWREEIKSTVDKLMDGVP